MSEDKVKKKHGNKDSPKIKELSGYNRRGTPIYKNPLGERVCSLENCYSKSQDSWLCGKHYSDGNDYDSYLESIKKPLNAYSLINDEYYEMSVSNSELVYKISKEDYEYAKSRNWWTEKGIRNYLCSKNYKDGVEKRLKFHSQILKEEIEIYRSNLRIKTRVIVNHINGDVTDNRRENLRVATQSENNMNKTIQKNNTTGIAGVCWHSRDNIWNSNITVDKKQIFLGNYYYLRNAVRARMEAEKKYFGEYSFINRDQDYKEMIENILDMPTLIEPPIRKRPINREFGIEGVELKKNGRYNAYIYNKRTNKRKSKVFSTFEEALKWRKDREVEVYGACILYEDEVIEKQI